MGIIIVIILVIAYVTGNITGAVCVWGSVAAMVFLGGEVYIRKD